MPTRLGLISFFVGLLATTSAAQSIALTDIEPEPGTASEEAVAELTGQEQKAESPCAGHEDAVAPADCPRCHRSLMECCCEGTCGWTFFGQWMLLQPRGADAVFAVASDACFGPPRGPANQIDFHSDSGFGVGLGKRLADGCSEIVGSFFHFEGDDSESATFNAVGVPLLIHPGLINCPASSTTRARATAGIDFERANIDYRRYIDCGCARLDWLLGFGYGELRQDLTAVYDEDIVEIESDAFGYGVRIGGGGEYGHGCVRLLGRADLTLLASNISASYTQRNLFGGGNAHFSQDLDRIMPVLDLEFGFAVDLTRHMVAKVGYMYSIWFNAVTVPEFASAVRRGDIDGDVSETLTFDGLFVRVEFNW